MLQEVVPAAVWILNVQLGVLYLTANLIGVI